MKLFQSSKFARLFCCAAVLCGGWLRPNSSANASANEKGGIAFILDHAKGLELNDEQKKKLNNLRVLEDRTRVKILAETDTKVTVHKLLEAVRKKDEAATGLAYSELMDIIVKKSAPVAKTMMDDLAKILTLAQIEKVNVLKEAADGKTKPGNPAAPRNNNNDPSKPKRGTEPPNPFEF